MEKSKMEGFAMPSTRRDATPQFPFSPAVIDAFKCAQEALAGDSNDDEHDALFALVEALGGYNLVEYRTYSPDWLIEDFVGWAGLDSGECPEEEDIQDYVREARPADSSPLEVKLVLCEWAEAIPTMRPDPFVYVRKSERS